MDTRFSRLCALGRKCGGSDDATEALVKLQTLSAICKYVNFWRIKYSEDELSSHFPSLLIWIEAPSGSGKNAISLFYKKNIFKESYSYMLSLLQIQADVFLVEEKKRLKGLFNYDAVELNKKDKEKLQKKYEIELGKYFGTCRDLDLDHWDDGTYEGFAKERAYMAKFRFGSKNLNSNEFEDRLRDMANNGHIAKLYDRVFELIDNPELGTKHTKNKEDKTEGSTGMGMNVYLTHSIISPQIREKVKDFVIRTIGRRGFILRETNESLESIRRVKPSREEVEEMSDEIRGMTTFLDDYCSAKQNHSGEDGNVILMMTPDAASWYDEYEDQLRVIKNNTFKDIASTEKNVLLALRQDKHRKVLRVACLLAVFNHYENLVIGVEDLEQAKALIEPFIDNASNFFRDDTGGQINAIIAFLQKKSVWVSAREMFDRGLFKVSKDSIQAPIKEMMMRDVILEVEKLGYKLEHQEYNRQDQYRIVLQTLTEPLTEPPITPVKEQVTTPTTPLEPLKDYSFTFQAGLAVDRKSGYIFSSFKKEDIWGKLAPMLKNEAVYSAIRWKDNIRLGENFLGADLIILDFDSGVTLEEAKNTFSPYKHLIATTQNHQKEKKGLVSDRFRVVLMGDCSITDKDVFKKVMSALVTEFKADRACADCARIYRGAPGALVTGTMEGADFPWYSYIERAKKEMEEEKNKRQQMVAYYGEEAVISKEKSIQTFELLSKDGYGFDAKKYILSLPVGKTFPVFCPWHSDHSPSAFVAHQPWGGLQISCTVCDQTKFIV